MSPHRPLETIERRLAQRAGQLEQDLAAGPDRDADTTREVGDRKDEAAAALRSTVSDAERERDLAELRAIRAALERIADGSYGLCVDCGAEIAAERLAAQPSAARCLGCQEAVEHRHLMLRH